MSDSSNDDDEVPTQESTAARTDHELLADYATRLAEVEAENDRLRERLVALEDSVGERTGDTDSSGGPHLSRRGALATLATLGVAGAASGSAAAAVEQHDHLGETWSGDPGNHGLKVDLGSGTDVAVLGESDSTDARVVRGHAKATSGRAIGIEGKADSTDAIGLLGNATATEGPAKGLEGRSAAKFGTGVIGFAKHATGTTKGVRGLAQSPNGRGVEATNTATSGAAYGVYAETSSPNGYGLYTPDDAGIEGTLDTKGTDFVVEAGTRSTGDARNVVQGHTSNAVTDDADGATVSGGGYDDGTTTQPNQVHDSYGTIGGGRANQAGSDDANDSTATFATVSGGESNSATDSNATVGGGKNNEASASYTTVAGGENNLAGALHSTVGGGEGNTADTKVGTTVAGGIGNDAINRWATVGGGQDNVSDGDNATVSGGDTNVASNQNATIGGGRQNLASGGQSTIAGGSSNEASGVNASVGGGYENVASARMATIPGGRANEAAGEYSFAAGRRASATHDGSVVFGDSTTTAVSSNQADVALFQQRVDIGDGGQSGVRLMVEGDSAEDDYLLRVRDAGSTKLLVEDNGGTSIGTFTSPPDDGLRVGGPVNIGQVGVSAYLSADQSIPDSNETTIDFDAVWNSRDDFGGLDTSTGIYTVQADGDYHIDFQVKWGLYDWQDDLFNYSLYINNSTSGGIDAWAEGHSALQDPTRSFSKCLFGLSAGDTIKVRVYQSSGESRDIKGTTDGNETFMTIHKVG